MRPGLKGLQTPSQVMNPPRKAASDAIVPNYVRTYVSGSYNWQCPATATYRFVLWGAGGGADTGGFEGGGGAAHAQKAERIRVGQIVPLAVAGLTSANSDGAATTVTLPSGLVSAGGGRKGDGGAGGDGGSATGGDINVGGNNNSGATGGAAGGAALFPGGAASGANGGASAPGGGGGVSGSGRPGAGGYLIIIREGA